MTITIGRGPNGPLLLDVDTLMKTRLLIQANSGGGKSWLIRLLAEQLFGKIPVIIIDSEGEYPSLREKFGYVLVGQGGETPADVRSAALVAEKLLELRASAVCDIFDTFRKNPQGRHAWVKAFCDGLLDAPKKLWHPLVLIIDEAHKFCPEGKAGESEASEAVIGVATAGRKRGICTVLATQRLGKLRKDASAELLNRLVGPTFEDIDLERAADLLSVLPADKREFFAKMRVLEPGNFFALGRALCKERTLVKIGNVQTTHPEMGKANYALQPPPPPEKVKLLLPKLADLPKAAEARERSLEALEKEVRSLKARLREMPKPVVTVDTAAIAKVKAEAERKADAYVRSVEKEILRLRGVVTAAGEKLAASVAGTLPERPAFDVAPIIHEMGPRLAPSEKFKAFESSKPRTIIEIDGRTWGKCERAIADFLHTYDTGEPRSKEQVAMATGYRPGSGGFGNALSRLASTGIIERDGGKLRALPGAWKPLQRPEWSLNLIRRKMTKCEGEIADVLMVNIGKNLTKEELAEMTPSRYSAGSGGFGNALSSLASLGFLSRAGGKISLSVDAWALCDGSGD